MTRLPSADVVVIGGGVIGTAIAYYLARSKQVKVALVERGGVASGTSSQGMGNVMVGGSAMDVKGNLILRAQKAYLSLDEDLLQSFEFEQYGSLNIVWEEGFVPILSKVVAEQRKYAIDVELVRQSELLQYAPYLSDRIVAGSLCRQDFRVNPIAVARSFAKRARELGATIYQHNPVCGLRLSTGKRIKTVETKLGSLPTEYVVVAAGVWSQEIVNTVGVRLPVRPSKGLVMVTEAVLLPNPPSLVEFLKLDTPRDNGNSDGPVYFDALYPTLNNNMLIGGTRQMSDDLDRTVPLNQLSQIARRASRLLPALNSVSIIRTWIGLRPATPDGLPIIGYIPEIQGMLLATGHCGDGVTLAPLTGEIVENLVLGQTESYLSAQLGPERFRS